MAIKLGSRMLRNTSYRPSSLNKSNANLIGFADRRDSLLGIMEWGSAVSSFSACYSYRVMELWLGLENNRQTGLHKLLIQLDYFFTTKFSKRLLITWRRDDKGVDGLGAVRRLLVNKNCMLAGRVGIILIFFQNEFKKWNWVGCNTCSPP